MIFYVWDYLGLVRALKAGWAEFETIGRKVFGGEFPRCGRCQAKIGNLQWQPPFKVRLTRGRAGDLCTDGQDILVSRQFREAWTESGLSGIHFESADVETSDPLQLDKLYNVIRVGTVTTRLDETASGLIVSNLVGCDYCRVASRQKVDRIRVDETTWTGLDVFRPSGLYGAMLVTDKFVDMVAQHKLTNFHFIHQDDYREPFIPEEP